MVDLVADLGNQRQRTAAEAGDSGVVGELIVVAATVDGGRK